MLSLSGTCIRLAVALALLASLLMIVPASASSGLCRVHNLETGGDFHSLRAAVRVAHGGDHLTVRGVCRGTTTIRKDLSVVGRRSASTGRAVLRGDDPGSVIRVLGQARVLMSDLIIRQGDARHGGGITNNATLVLRDVVVRGNHARVGGGVYNSGTLKLGGSTVISGNEGSFKGGGVRNTGSLTIGGSSAIRANTADWGGGIYSSYGTVVLQGASVIRDNSAMGFGGGVDLKGGRLALGGDQRHRAQWRGRGRRRPRDRG